MISEDAKRQRKEYLRLVERRTVIISKNTKRIIRKNRLKLRKKGGNQPNGRNNKY